MENKDDLFEAGGDFGLPKPSQDFPQLRRELDSMDDFEHLGHDSLNGNQKENDQNSKTSASGSVNFDPHHQPSSTVKDDLLLLSGVDFPPSDLQKIINKGVDVDEGAVLSGFIDKTDTSKLPEKDKDDFFSSKTTEIMSNKNLIDDFPSTYDGKEKLDQYLQEESNNKKIQNNDPLFSVKDATQDFMEAEKGTKDSISNKFEDFEDSPRHESYLSAKKSDPVKETFSSVENLLSDDFRDVKEEYEHEKVKEKEPSPVPEKKPTVIATPPVIPQEVEKPKEIKKEEKKIFEKKKEDSRKPTNVIEAEVLFSKMGLEMAQEDGGTIKKVASEIVDDVLNGVKDRGGKCGGNKSCQRSLLCVMFSPNTWFTPEKLNPRVESLIYWRDPKKSGPVFGGVLVVLLALTYFSLISVIAYLSLIGLTGTISFRVYKNVVQAVQKTGEGHPFKEFLEWDLALPPEKVKEISEVVVAHVNAGLSALRRLFLVEDLIDSIKFGVFMWTLTYLGAWFNGMTLVILAWVALFTLPKVYETNKTQIDANLEIVKSKLAEVTSKVKAAIPLGKKEEKKE